ncbi:hypothetical protein C2W64_03729 [Brevibacillus laterosporus]|nr:hypothetical protein C2W64_03729 [Brevibacillus laterosporus]
MQVVGVEGNAAGVDQLYCRKTDFFTVTEAVAVTITEGDHVDVFNEFGNEFFDHVDAEDVLVAFFHVNQNMFSIASFTFVHNTFVHNLTSPCIFHFLTKELMMAIVKLKGY